MPFEIPDSWEWTTIGEIFQHNTGKALNKSNGKEGTLKSYLTTSNVYWNSFDFTEVKEMYFKDNEIDKCTISKGDLLVCEGGDIGRSAIWEYDYTICIQNHIHRLRPYEKISIELYLYILMLYKWTDRIQGKGIGLQGLSSGLLDKLIVPLPPYKEQHQIVAAIEKWFSIINILDDEKTDLNLSIKKTKLKILELAIQGKLVSQNASDEPAKNLLQRINPKIHPCDTSHYTNLPQGWTVIPLRDLCTTINGLWKGKKPPFINVGVIRNANFTKDFKLDFSNIAYLDVEKKQYEKRKLRYGDIIIEKSGGSDNQPVGRTILFSKKEGYYSFSNFTAVLRIKENFPVLPKYLSLFLHNSYNKGVTKGMQTQTTGIHNLIFDQYLEIPVLIPPLAEQIRIINKIEMLFELLNSISVEL